jgi:hypothetical protein
MFSWLSKLYRWLNGLKNFNTPADLAAGKDTKGLDSNAMIAYLVKAVQDLQLRVKQLEGVK